MNYEAILFDFDGVLADSEPIHWSCWQDVIAPFGYSVEWEPFRINCVGVHERGTVEWLRMQRTPPVPFDDLWELYPQKKQLFRQKMLRPGAISPEVVALIGQLSEQYLIGVVTSSGRVEIEPVLEAAGVMPLLKTAVYGGDVVNLKPAPDPYLLAVQRLGTNRALVIEDSPAGIAAGRAAGLDVLEIANQSEMVKLLSARLGIACPD